jgi:hypothetical protein
MLTREDMIDEMMEGIAFEDDDTIRRALIRFSSMTYSEVLKEWKEVVGE